MCGQAEKCGDLHFACCDGRGWEEGRGGRSGISDLGGGGFLEGGRGVLRISGGQFPGEA